MTSLDTLASVNILLNVPICNLVLLLKLLKRCVQKVYVACKDILEEEEEFYDEEFPSKKSNRYYCTRIQMGIINTLSSVDKQASLTT